MAGIVDRLNQHGCHMDLLSGFVPYFINVIVKRMITMKGTDDELFFRPAEPLFQ